MNILMEPIAARRRRAPETARVINQCVGRRVRTIRTASGHSQEHLAQILGLSFQQVQKFESGASRISPDKLLNIARHYDMPIAWFFEEVPTDLLPPSAVTEAKRNNSQNSHYRLRLEVGRELQYADDRLLRPLLELLRSSHRLDTEGAA
jgi:transcriptional regulator with XRE-family HTH domain